MKHLKLFFACLLMAVLSIGQVWATDELAYALTPTAGSDNGYANAEDIEIDEITWNVTGNATMTPWRLGGKSLSNVDRAVYSKTAMSDAITKVELTVGNASNITVNSLKLIVASNSDFSTQIDEVSQTFTANSTITFSPTSPTTEWTTGAYYKFVFNVSVTGTSNKFVEFSEAKFYKEQETPAYTIAATSSNTNYGTVSVEGATITATPSDCYQVVNGDDGYSVTSGNATVSHTGNSNTLSVTPTSSCTIQVVFEKKTVNTYIDEIQGYEVIEDCDTHDAPSLEDKTYTSNGTCVEQHWHFIGWVTYANKTNPTDANIITPGTSMTANGITYYAVWAKGSAGSSATVTFNSSNSDSSSENTSISNQVSTSSRISSYSSSKAYNGTYGLKLGTGSAVGSVTCTLSSAITTKTITIDAKKYGSDTGNFTCTVNGSTTFGSAQSPSSTGGTLTFSLAANANPIAVSSVTIATSTKRGYIKTITVGEAATYSDYKTVCCTELGSINGSFLLHQLNGRFFCSFSS